MTERYPHVVQFETRRHQLERELRLIHERTQAQAHSQPSRPEPNPVSALARRRVGARSACCEPSP